LKALQKLQNASAYSRSAAEKLDWSYYDVYALATGSTQYDYFAVPQGQAGKTLQDSNFPVAGQLAQGQSFTIFAIKPVFVSAANFVTATVQAFYTFLFDTTVEVKITGKDSMGTWTLAELFGTSTLAGLTPSNAGDNEPLIQPDYKGVFPLNIPLKIGATQTIQLQLRQKVATPAELDGCRLKMSLQGKLVRMS